MLKSKFGIIFWTHLILIITAYLSPILFRWEIIGIGVLYLVIQQIILKGCVLTIAQFGKDPYNTFYYKYLTLLGFKPNKKKLKFIMTYIMPFVVLSLALFLQIILKFQPIIW
jgi:hypothetical protein